ncbi:hypothetical protein [Prevotella heparinolytica]|uniref:hypothetical protein n=1 Tax=Prevotella heparinolytica TaxID=28113 RepID=UPI0014047F10|nr:hypothetical protein [Bacteroides heparinolyticus]
MRKKTPGNPFQQFTVAFRQPFALYPFDVYERSLGVGVPQPLGDDRQLYARPLPRREW